MDGEDVTKEIRSKEVTEIVSPVSSIPEVRENLIYIQRKIAEGKDVVMEGRDITTVVFPNADVKIFLDCSVEERANRRYKQNIEKNIECTYEEVLANIIERNKLETERNTLRENAGVGSDMYKYRHEILSEEKIISQIKETVYEAIKDIAPNSEVEIYLKNI